MIDIKDKKDCCGCAACVQRCPKQCISLKTDEEGFLYPKVNADLCIDCGLCEKVCPVINQNANREPLHCFAAYNEDEEVRLKSSSGGVFTLLAEKMIEKGGVVFGARFDKDWSVVHDFAETKDGLAAFRGSKYLQSRIGNSFAEAERFLKAGRQVLFSGTPCQIAGLKGFLRKEYEGLLAVEIVCHGVPSPKIWHRYLKEKQTQMGADRITNVEFRNKKTGWKRYSFQLEYEKGDRTCIYAEYASQNPYMKGFLSDIYLRPSCHACPAKHLKSGADITLGDFWGIQHRLPEMDDDKGVCGLLCNTQKAMAQFAEISVVQTECQFLDVAAGNPALLHSVKEPVEKRNRFFSRLNGRNFEKEVSKYTQVPFKFRVKIFLYNMLKGNRKG